MARFNVEVTCDNESFYTSDGAYNVWTQLSKSMSYCQQKIDNGELDFLIFDDNGNRIGSAHFTTTND